MSKFCRNCGKKLNDNSQFCDRCGTSQKENNNHMQIEEYTPNGLSTAGYIMGIVSLFIHIYGIVGLFAFILSIAGLSETPEENRKANSRAKIGIVLGIIGAVTGFFIYRYWLFAD